MLDPVEFESAVEALEASGGYRVLRQLPPLPPMPDPTALLRRGLFVDVETTGLDPAHDEIIQLAMVPFAFSSDRIVGVGEPYMRYRQPSIPIPEKITQLTGIDIDTVAFAEIDPQEVAALAAGVEITLAHNAAFDRRFLERFCPLFATQRWGCSQSQIPWETEGFQGTKLSYLLAQMGFFYDAHRADADCLATLTLLTMTLPKSGENAFAKLLAASREPSLRVWAIGAPYEAKEGLRSRGYRWNPGENGKAKAWYRDIAVNERVAEIEFLSANVYCSNRKPLMAEVTAFDKFSDRC